MLSIQSSSDRKSQPHKCTPHLLPTRIHHNGSIPSTAQYFTPTTDPSGQPHVYFRGRHMHGTPLPLPENYTGAVLHVTDKDAPAVARNSEGQEGIDEEGEDAEEVEVEVKVAEKVGEFDEFVVWGHGGVVDEREDAYVKGVREWIGFAEAMHGDEEEQEQANAQDGEKKG